MPLCILFFTRHIRSNLFADFTRFQCLYICSQTKWEIISFVDLWELIHKSSACLELDVHKIGSTNLMTQTYYRFVTCHFATLFFIPFRMNFSLIYTFPSNKYSLARCCAIGNDMMKYTSNTYSLHDLMNVVCTQKRDRELNKTQKS